jgi:integrase
MKLSHIITEILPMIAMDKSPNTLRSYNFAVRNMIRVIGDLDIKKITVRNIETFKAQRLKEVTARSVNMDFRSLKAMFTRIVNMEELKINPFAKSKQLHVPENKPLYLSQENISLILETIDDQYFRTIILFAYLTGCRLEEILHVDWSDIDLSSGVLMIRNKKDFTVKSKKERGIPLHALLIEALTNLERRSETLIFTDLNGRKFRSQYISKKFKKVIRKLKIDDAVHFHTLRHTYATHLIQAGVNIYEVSRFLGHSSVTVTEVYAHANPEKRHDLINKLRIK